MKQKTNYTKENQKTLSNRLKEIDKKVNPYDRTYFSYTIENKSSPDGELFIIERKSHRIRLKSGESIPALPRKSVKTRKILNRSSNSQELKKEIL